jgi:uncharacterized protein with GYD domain
MNRYIALLKFTDKGAANVAESTSRAHSFDDLAANSGVTVEGQFWTTGQYDGVLILSSESEASVLRLLASLASRGNVRTETLKAFTDREFDELMKA